MRVKHTRLWRVLLEVQRGSARPSRHATAGRSHTQRLAERARRWLSVRNQRAVGVAQQVNQADLVLLREERNAPHQLLYVLARWVDRPGEAIPG